MDDPEQPAERSPRARVLEAADRLFDREGPRSVGVDAVTAASGVAKTTLYRHFPSKDELIVAYLEERDRRFWAWWEQALAEHAALGNPVLAIFRGLELLVASPSCHGCTFIVTAAEFPDAAAPGHRVALRHKRRVQARFAELARALGARDPEGLGRQLRRAMDGAFVERRVFGPVATRGELVALARALLHAHDLDTEV